MKKWIFATGLLLLAGLIGWFFVASQPPAIAVHNVSVRYSAAGKMEILAELEIMNSMKIPLSYFKADYQISEGDVRLAAGDLDVAGRVAAGGKSSVELPLIIDVDNVQKLRRAKGERPLNLIIAGALHFDLKWKKIAVPYRFSKEVQPGHYVCEVIEVPAEIKDGDLVTLSPVFRITGDLPEKTISVVADYTVQMADTVVATGKADLKNVDRTPQRLTGKLFIELDLEKWRSLRRQYGGTVVELGIRGNVEILVESRRIETPFTFSMPFEMHSRPFSLAVKDVRVKSISRQAVAMELNLSLTSEISRSIDDLKAEYQVFADKTSLVQGTLKLPHLPARGRGEACLPLTIEISSLKQVKDANLGNIPLLIQGQAWGTVNDKKVHAPFSVVKEIELTEKPFEVKLQKIRVRRLIAPSIIEVSLMVKNATARSIKELKIDGKIYIGEGLEVDVLNDRVSLLSGQSSVLNLEVKRERGAIVEMLRSMIKEKRAGGRWKLKFRGKTEDGAEIFAESEEKFTTDVEGEN